MKSIVDDPQGKVDAAPGGRSCTKLLLLDHKIQALGQLSKELQDFVQANGAEAVPYTSVFDYDHTPYEEVLRAILPAEITVPVSFETIGHIAHLNLRDEQLPYKDVIGQVLLEKNPHIKTVLRKVGNIENEFRVFDMEIIAGVKNTVTEVKEHNVMFRFDFSKVYWNSRLQTEHRRIVDLLSPQDVICDMFCGVGPFAVPAAKKGCTVHANDLNPASTACLSSNVLLNKVSDNVTVYTSDARDFVRHLRKLQVAPFTRVLMNLPACAIEFLDVFRGLYRRSEESVLPIIHCYCFSSAEDRKTDVIQRVEAVLGGRLSEEQHAVSVRDVRHVAPRKDMCCISFKLPEAVAFDEAEPDCTDQTLDTNHPEKPENTTVEPTTPNTTEEEAKRAHAGHESETKRRK